MKRECWYKEGIQCNCEENHCNKLVEENSKLVYCNDKKCMFNIELPYKVFLDRGLNHKPFDDDGFTGVCGRQDVGVAPLNSSRYKKMVTCRFRSDKTFSHFKFPDPERIEGGSYPDPIDPHAAFYH